MLVLPISLGIIAVVTIVLLICKLDWKYYLIGSMVACLTHSMMVKQTSRTEKMAKLDPEQKVFNPKKSAILWMLARVLVTVAVFAALIFMSDIKTDRNKALISIIIAVSGFMTVKIVFILCCLFIREKVDES